jgi:hypothetical protein
MLLVGPGLLEYRVRQRGMLWQVDTLADWDPVAIHARIGAELAGLWAATGLKAPQLRFGPWLPSPVEAKRRRVRLEHPPEGLRCAF